MSKAAETILRKSIEDIAAGQWCQADLGQVENEFEESYSTSYISTKDALLEYAPTKQLACAVGLLSMYGDKGLERVKFQGATFVLGLKEPTNASPKPIRDCVDALFESIPVKARKRLIEDHGGEVDSAWDEENETIRPISEWDTGAKAYIIICYNDESTTTQSVALRWFRKALKSIEGSN